MEHMCFKPFGWVDWYLDWWDGLDVRRKPTRGPNVSKNESDCIIGVFQCYDLFWGGAGLLHFSHCPSQGDEMGLGKTVQVVAFLKYWPST